MWVILVSAIFLIYLAYKEGYNKGYFDGRNDQRENKQNKFLK